MFKNWKTSLTGIILAMANVTVNGVTAKQMFVSVCFAALGILSKDWNVTGIGQ